MKLSAAVLAGGFSRRMGRDKALLPDAQHGTLLHRQLAVLMRLQPAEVFVSCRQGQLLPALPPGPELVHDTGQDGPLGGVAALLARATGDLLLVVAVDLGALTEDFLRDLLARAEPGCGVVPRSTRGLEPLAAIYPTLLAAEAQRRLAPGEDHSMQGFVRHALADGRLRSVDLAPGLDPVLANWNAPEDLPH